MSDYREAVSGGNIADLPANKYHEMEGRRGHHHTLPYATPQAGTKFGQIPRPPTSGVSAIVPFPYTIVDTRTLGGAARRQRVGITQEP